MISHQLTPPQGWQYFESRTKTRIVALNWEGLVKAVKDHRFNNGVLIGDNLPAEIEKQIEEKHPHLKLNKGVTGENKVL
jgi:hypothetical protein